MPDSPSVASPPRRRWRRRLLTRGLPTLAALYLLLLIPDSVPDAPRLSPRSPFAWNQDERWKSLEERFLAARQVPPDERRFSIRNELHSGQVDVARLREGPIVADDPLLDRIDLHVEVPRLKFEKLECDESGERSAEIRKRVESARKLQQERFKNLDIITNSEMNSHQIRKFCPLDEKSIELLRAAVSSMRLSARAYYRLIKIARTIADLEGSLEINPSHILEALQYRPKRNN